MRFVIKRVYILSVVCSSYEQRYSNFFYVTKMTASYSAIIDVSHDTKTLLLRNKVL